MSACEKCWSDAGGDSEIYRRLSRERSANPCSPTEHAGGEAAGFCPVCDNRTVHAVTGICIVCSGERTIGGGL